MIGLLVFKEKLKQFYGKYNIYIVPVVKFLVGFLTFWLINANVGFMTKLKNPLIPVVMGLIASFIPYGVTAFLAGIFILIHVSQVSLEIALIIFVFMLAVTVLYYGFRPGDGYLLLLTPLLFFLRIPYVVPLVVGLSGSLDRSGVLRCLYLLYPDVFKAECGDTDRKLHDGDGGPFYPDRKKCVWK